MHGSALAAILFFFCLFVVLVVGIPNQWRFCIYLSSCISILGLLEVVCRSAAGLGCEGRYDGVKGGLGLVDIHPVKLADRVNTRAATNLSI
jgi:hypothetical protein